MAIAYFLSWRCHGTWLPGDDRGWVDAQHNRYGTPYRPPDAHREEGASEQMHGDVESLAQADRDIVRKAIQDHCDFKRWRLLSFNVRSNHVHVVVGDTGLRPEMVMGQLKSWATRRLREAGRRGSERVWAREGSTRHLFTDEAVLHAVEYVERGQGEDLE